MKRMILVSFLVAVSVTSVFLPEARAIDPPHDFPCTSCHTTHLVLGSTGYDNVCLTCHRPGVPRGGNFPFIPADAANPFGTYSGPQPAVRYQTSHKWFGSDAVPQAGATPPLSAPLNGSSVKGSLACTRCHYVHGPRSSTTNSAPFLRGLNDADQLCFDCHRSRVTATHFGGTHPVNVSYSSAIRRRGTTPGIGLKPVPVNANPSNPTAAMKLKKGSVVCSTCHGTHYTDSNSATFDNHSGYYKLTQSAGDLLRTDLRGKTSTDVNACTACHDRANHSGTVKQQNVQCADCHGGHVIPADGSAPNVYLLRRYVNMSTPYGAIRNRAVFFTVTSPKNYVNPSGTGICQVCHAVPAPGGIYPDEHASLNSRVCIDCHNHSSMPGSFSATGCNRCHGTPPLNNVAGPDGYASNYFQATGINESTTAHRRHGGGGSDYLYGCEQCHKGNRHNVPGTFQDVFLNTAGIIASTGGSTPTYSTSGRTCSNVYCHSDGGPRDASLASTYTYRNPPGWVNGAGKIVGCSACHAMPPATNVHGTHLAKGYSCNACHAATISASGGMSDRSKHADGVKTVVFASGGAPRGGLYDAATATCTVNCHGDGTVSGAPVVKPVWTQPATGKCGSCHYVTPTIAPGSASTIGSNRHGTHLSAAYGPGAWAGSSADACRACHPYSATQPDPQHVDGTVEVNAGAGSACANCHPGTLPAWTDASRLPCTSCHAATPSRLPNGVVAPYKANFASTGHGQATPSFSSSRTCESCHDPNSQHITGSLGDSMRLSMANDNTLCASCHNDAAKVPTASRRNVTSHVMSKGGPAIEQCKTCHDPHGTTNLSMIRLNINGRSVVFTNTSTGFVQTTAPYAGLCQICHTGTNHWRSGQAPDGHPSRNCLSCHSHSATYAFAPVGGGGCDGCHGYPPAPAGFRGTHGNYSSARMQDYAGGAGAHLIPQHVKKTAVPAEGWDNCTICHGNGSSAPTTHVMQLPVKPSKITIDLADRYKFSPTLPLGAKQYNGVLTDDGTNATGSCFNVRCHFKPSKRWSVER